MPANFSCILSNKNTFAAFRFAMKMPFCIFAGKNYTLNGRLRTLARPHTIFYP